MKYRAVAVGLVIDGHPVQAYFTDLVQAHMWARTVATNNKVTVHIYQTYERVVKRVRPAKVRALRTTGKPYGRVRGASNA